jgi:hypothetical protein
MGPFGCPLGTFLAYVVSACTVVAAVVWSVNDARKGREE